MRRAVLLLLALVVAGCGGAREHGTATLWVTRDQGAHVLYVGHVPAGLTAMQALDRKLSITTRYGGRFVQSIDGVTGSDNQQDWFFYVNGIEGDRSAAEVTLHPGDIEWWDYRHWTATTMDVPFVIGSYPEPFLHALPGKTSVVGPDHALAAAIAAQVHGLVNAKVAVRNIIVIGPKLPPSTARITPFRHGARLELGIAAARKLAADPHALRYRY